MLRTPKPMHTNTSESCAEKPTSGYNIGMSILKTLRLFGDEGRVRLMQMLAKEELSVAELQEILDMGQSRISMQLSQLKQAGFVDVRRVRAKKPLSHNGS